MSETIIHRISETIQGIASHVLHRARRGQFTASVFFTSSRSHEGVQHFHKITGSLQWIVDHNKGRIAQQTFAGRTKFIISSRRRTVTMAVAQVRLRGGKDVPPDLGASS